VNPSDPSVLVTEVGHTMVVTINRPESLNSSNAVVATGIGEALEAAERDDSIRAVVLTGSGDRAFCAGADVKAAAKGEPLYAPGHADWGFAGFARHPIGKPTIAAINGFALGGGAELVLASDLAVMAETARFGLPEVRLGLIPAAGGAIRLPRHIPRKLALELLLTGDPIDAGRCFELGLVNRVVARARVLDAALELAERIALGGPRAVRAAKLVGTATAEEDELWALNDKIQEGIRGSDEMREGLLSFVEKRPPAWRGTDG